MGSSFEDDNDFFEHFLDMIPSRIYYPPKPPEDAWKTRGQPRKKPSKQELRQREQRRKVALFDPTKCRTVLQVQRDIFASETSSKPSNDEKDHVVRSKAVDSSRQEDSMLEIRRRYHEKLDSFKKKRTESQWGDGDRPSRSKPNVENQREARSNTQPSSESSVELEEKPKPKRKTKPPVELKEKPKPKRKAKSPVELKAKPKPKRKRSEEDKEGSSTEKAKKAVARGTEAGHSDSKRSEISQKKKKRRKQNVKPAQEIEPKPLSSSDSSHKKASKKSREIPASPDSSSASELNSGSNDFMFGNISKPKVTADATKRPQKKAKKEHLLKKLEARNERLSRLSGADAEKIRAADGLDAAIKRARGEKVVDNLSKLKKTMKKREKTKEKHAKEWKERKKLQRDIVKSAADKRRENMDAHKKQRKTKKTKKKSSE